MAPRPSGAASFSLLALLLLGAFFCAAPPPAAEAARLSALGRTLVVEASPKAGQVLHAGEDTITVTWTLNATAVASGEDAGYRAVRVALCYAPASQKDRGWRKASDDLSKDKACQRKIAEKPYAGAGAATVEYRVAVDVPTASYHARAYALDASGAEVGYGQTAPGYYFDVAGVTGIHASLRVAAGVFSAFSIAALAFFLAVEKRRKDV
ncbi:High-affinity nitrate transporter-activating protein 2.1 [Dichanthelium oligosanthes]|uniref:High-affinity nitrate transporter n=1 Tax=Dichanthelium oligosanthes TaxID=888268 RepID=A0A1E5UKD3_9POAL|nr:High-affinity nitrate transporter-activating protein 2.1 [Dichanthelium oligosanthes]